MHVGSEGRKEGADPLNRLFSFDDERGGGRQAGMLQEYSANDNQSIDYQSYRFSNIYSRLFVASLAPVRPFSSWPPKQRSTTTK